MRGDLAASQRRKSGVNRDRDRDRDRDRGCSTALPFFDEFYGFVKKMEKYVEVKVDPKDIIRDMFNWVDDVRVVAAATTRFAAA